MARRFLAGMTGWSPRAWEKEWVGEGGRSCVCVEGKRGLCGRQRGIRIVGAQVCGAQRALLRVEVWVSPLLGSPEAEGEKCLWKI